MSPGDDSLANLTEAAFWGVEICIISLLEVLPDIRLRVSFLWGTSRGTAFAPSCRSRFNAASIPLLELDELDAAEPFCSTFCERPANEDFVMLFAEEPTRDCACAS